MKGAASERPALGFCAFRAANKCEHGQSKKLKYNGESSHGSRQQAGAAQRRQPAPSTVRSAADGHPAAMT